MSYPYPYPENYSTPTTPSFPCPWEVEQQQADVQLQQQQQQQQQHQASRYEPTLPPPERVVPSQRPSEGHSDEPILLHSINEARSGCDAASVLPPSHVDAQARFSGPSSSSSPASTVGPLRVSLAHGAQHHPYRRPQTADRARRSTAEHEQHVRFVQPGMQGPSPAQSRVPSYGSPLASTSTSSPTTHATQPAVALQRHHLPQARGRYIIRTDVHYDTKSKVLTAMLELPGVRRSELSVTLSTCLYNRVRQLCVSGKINPMFPEDAGYVVRERKFGEFARTLAVPPETTAEDISAEFEDGILVLKISCGPPADSEDRKDIPIS